jgi:CTD kinase subunit gamma
MLSLDLSSDGMRAAVNQNIFTSKLSFFRYNSHHTSHPFDQTLQYHRNPHHPSTLSTHPQNPPSHRANNSHPHLTMADPFEVRQRFTTLLSHLSASHISLQKAALYALKNREMDEDLHSCILEQLERTNMNTRANIMFFIECLCEMAIKDNSTTSSSDGARGIDGSAMGYVRMLQRDILAVVECVVGDEGANIRVVRKVLLSLEKQGMLMSETVRELEAVLKSREVENGFSLVETPVRNGAVKMDKRQIEQRIEEDRERHKRQRETIWAVAGEGDEEMDRMWEEGNGIGEDDYIIAREEREEKEKIIALG